MAHDVENTLRKIIKEQDQKIAEEVRYNMAKSKEYKKPWPNAWVDWFTEEWEKACFKLWRGGRK